VVRTWFCPVDFASEELLGARVDKTLLGILAAIPNWENGGYPLPLGLLESSTWGQNAI